MAILTETRNKVRRPLTLREFRVRLESQPSMFDPDDWGACGCFMDGTPETSVTIGATRTATV